MVRFTFGLTGHHVAAAPTAFQWEQRSGSKSLRGKKNHLIDLMKPNRENDVTVNI